MSARLAALRQSVVFACHGQSSLWIGIIPRRRAKICARRWIATDGNFESAPRRRQTRLGRPSCQCAAERTLRSRFYPDSGRRHRLLSRQLRANSGLMHGSEDNIFIQSVVSPGEPRLRSGKTDRLGGSSLTIKDDGPPGAGRLSNYRIPPE